MNVLEYEDLRDVVLLGHSYGGMVLTAVADRAAARLARLIYLDALLPQDGECAFDLLLSRSARKLGGARPGLLGEGWRVPSWNPPDWRSAPMPLKPLQQPLRLTGTGSSTVPGAYVHCTAKSGWDFWLASSADRARERGWPVYELATGHSPLRTDAGAPALVDLLLKLV